MKIFSNRLLTIFSLIVVVVWCPLVISADCSYGVVRGKFNAEVLPEGSSSLLGMTGSAYSVLIGISGLPKNKTFTMECLDSESAGSVNTCEQTWEGTADGLNVFTMKVCSEGDGIYVNLSDAGSETGGNVLIFSDSVTPFGSSAYSVSASLAAVLSMLLF